MSAELTQAERGRLLEATHFSHRTCEHIAPAVEKILTDRLARVEALAEAPPLGSDRATQYRHGLVRLDALRAALAPAPTEDANVAHAGSVDVSGAFEGAADHHRAQYDPMSGRIDNWSER